MTRIGRMLLVLIGICLVCTGCEQLPGEEYAFAVVLGASWAADEQLWTISARIPTYQEAGSYQTISASDDTPEAALFRLDQAAPMVLHLGQLRLLVVDERTASERGLADLVQALAVRVDLRREALVCVSEEPARQLLDRMAPKTGTRLSKSLDVLVESRQRIGVIPRLTFQQAADFGLRQSPVLPRITTKEDTFDLEGAALLCGLKLTATLTAEETQLLSLLNGQIKKGTFVLSGEPLMVSAFSSRLMVKEDQIDCSVKGKFTGAGVDTGAFRDAFSQAVQRLSQQLQEARCDALGLARQTVTGAWTGAAWMAEGWPDRVLSLPWTIRVEAEPAK